MMQMVGNGAGTGRFWAQLTGQKGVKRMKSPGTEAEDVSHAVTLTRQPGGHGPAGIR